jgi:hypothetical protein
MCALSCPVKYRDDHSRGVDTQQHRGEAWDQRGEQGSVGPVEAGLGVGSAEDRDLVSQHEELDVLGRRRAAEQHQPAEEPGEDQVEEA